MPPWSGRVWLGWTNAAGRDGVRGERDVRERRVHGTRPGWAAGYRGGVKPVEILGVRVESPGNQPVVLLREVDGSRMLPIWVGAAEAAAIAYAQQGVEPPRPLTHDLFVTVIGALGHRLESVHITALKDNVFFAELHFAGGIVVESRPSDAIALALRTNTTVLGAEALFDEAGVTVPVEEGEDEDEPGMAQDELEAFKEFLDQVSADDFGTDLDPGEGPPQPE